MNILDKSSYEFDNNDIEVSAIEESPTHSWRVYFQFKDDSDEYRFSAINKNEVILHKRDLHFDAWVLQKHHEGEDVNCDIARIILRDNLGHLINKYGKTYLDTYLIKIIT